MLNGHFSILFLRRKIKSCRKTLVLNSGCRFVSMLMSSTLCGWQLGLQSCIFTRRLNSGWTSIGNVCKKWRCSSYGWSCPTLFPWYNDTLASLVSDAELSWLFHWVSWERGRECKFSEYNCGLFLSRCTSYIWRREGSRVARFHICDRHRRSSIEPCSEVSWKLTY